MGHLADDKVLIFGDILVNTMMPNFRDGHIKTWIATLEQISKMPLFVIVPGHGELMTTKDVTKIHRMMEQLYADVETGYKNNLMNSEIRKTMDLSEWEKLKYFDQLIGREHQSYVSASGRSNF